MNSEEIKAFPRIGTDNPEKLVGKNIEVINLSFHIEHTLWLKEIAYQLAVMNERLGKWDSEVDGFLDVRTHKGGT